MRQDQSIDLLDDLVSRGYSRRKIYRDPCFCMQLGCPFDEYLRKKIQKSKRRYKLRYEEKKLYKSADVRVTRYLSKEIMPEVNRRIAVIQLESWMKRRSACGDGIQLFDFIYGDAEYKRFWATDCYKVFRVIAGRGFMGRLIVMFYYVFFRLGQIK